MKRPVHLGRLVASLGMTFAMSAQALTLGKLSVLSSIGQPLVAEIEVPEISSDEANSIRVGMASAEAFKSAGLDYTPAAAQITVVGKRRTDGRAILELRTSQPVNAPYLDLVLEVTWNTGRMLRDYTVLLDPPATSTQALVVSALTLPIQTMSTTSVALPVPDVTTTRAPLPLPDAASPPAAVTPRSLNRPVLSPNSRQASITTRRGDTAAAIANSIKPEGVSLDQMLVAMLRSNPDAFVAGNVNRLKSGVVIEAPSGESVRAIKESEAKNNIQAQARDFNEYRKKLSSNVAIADAGQPTRSASGKAVASVADRQAIAPTDDRLTLAKPNTATATVETKIAQERAAAEIAARASELQKNIADLKKMAPALAASAPASDSTIVAPPLPAPVAQAPAPVLPSPATVSPVRPPPAPATDSSFLDALILNPLTLPVAGGVGLLVLLTAFFGIRRKRNAGFGETQNSTQNFVATRQPSDTIFGPMGASDVNTKESPASSTMVYSPSQLSPTTGDVDPIAEADVYLAYNRDVQAEEILKAAKLDMPKRTDVRVKLLELYVKRFDLDSFNADAQELHMMTDGEGDAWSQARNMARDIGSKHPLFNVSSLAAVTSEAPSVTSLVSMPVSDPNSGLIDFNLDTFSLDVPSFNPQPLDLPITEDPKLALAEEYLSIGDQMGARALIEEVIKLNAQPQTVTQAHQMLARLS